MPAPGARGPGGRRRAAAEAGSPRASGRAARRSRPGGEKEFGALGVIGAAVIDRIFPPGDPSRPVRSMGGIFYSLHALAALAPHPSFVVPALRLGADAASFLRSSLAGMGLDIRFLSPTAARQNRVDLHYTTAESRREILRGGVPPLGMRGLSPFLDEIAALYVNFVAGNELTLPTLRRVRRSFAGPIYADLHSLLLGRARSGLRFPRPLRDWREWVACFDVVQCNDREAAILGWDPAAARGRMRAAGTSRGARKARAVPKGSDAAAAAARVAPLDARGAERLAAEILGLGPRLFILTAGPRPLRAWAKGRPPWRLAPVDAGPRRDPTGCGDVLGAAFCALHFLRGLPPRRALAGAAEAAAWNATRVGTDDLAAGLRAWYFDRDR